MFQELAYNGRIHDQLGIFLLTIWEIVDLLASVREFTHMTRQIFVSGLPTGLNFLHPLFIGD